MSTDDQIITTIKEKKSSNKSHFSTNDSAGGFRVDVKKMFNDSSRVRREVREFNSRFSRVIKK